ncbi:SURF1 family protein [Aestuariibius insulae]|uniref:SURF1 family protein n=1 Tax=Aestuariibius insulae TaxID=2058287 RepID=UPI00345E602C
MTRYLSPILLGAIGCAVLIALGVWQLQRLEWKEGVLSQIEARLAGDPVTLSDDLTEAEDEYRATRFRGTPVGDVLYVLDSGTAAGTGYRVIQAFETSDMRVLVDRGLVGLDGRGTVLATDEMDVSGHLLWPDDVNSSTPAPEGNLWFGRDVAAMSDVLETAPVMVVLAATSVEDPGVTPLPVDTSGIPNDHLSYAITWFSLAVVWLAMTGYWISRIRARTA